jgi:hypothetical protein
MSFRKLLETTKELQQKLGEWKENKLIQLI